MMVIYIFAIVIACLYIALQVWQTVVLFVYKDKPGDAPAEWPNISILVAARNEEKNIADCLEALIALDYPTNKLQILIGNDQSKDLTLSIAEKYAQKHSYIQIIQILDDQSGLKAKARVMAQMDKFATGEYFLVTDADVRVKPEWAKTLVRHVNSTTGVASGTTMVYGKGVFCQLEGMDWAYFMGLLNVISYSGVPATAVGNNMIVRADAYWQTGGYSAIKFSITEDYKLYSQVCKIGWKWDNIMTPQALAYSKPISNFTTLLHQRKRWLSGGKELPWYWWLFFGIFGLFYFTLPIILYVNLFLGLGIWVIKWIIQSIQVNKIYSSVGEAPKNIGLLLLYECFICILTICTAIFFIFPAKTVWKGRKY